GNRIGEEVAPITNRHGRQLRLILGAAVVEGDSGLSRDEVAEKIGLREWQVVRIVERKRRTLECATDRDAHANVANVGASLPRLTNCVNCPDDECWIEVRCAEE